MGIKWWQSRGFGGICYIPYPIFIALWAVDQLQPRPGEDHSSSPQNHPTGVICDDRPSVRSLHSLKIEEPLIIGHSSNSSLDSSLSSHWSTALKFYKSKSSCQSLTSNIHKYYIAATYPPNNLENSALTCPCLTDLGAGQNLPQRLDPSNVKESKVEIFGGHPCWS